MPDQVGRSVFAFLPSAKVVCENYAFTPVCYSGQRGMSASMHAGIHTPLADTLPWADTLPGLTPKTDTPQGRHPWADMPPGQTPPGHTHPLGTHTPWAHTPPGQTPHQQTPLQADTPAQCMLGYTVPSACWDRHGYCCGRYASYWNAFLL